MIISLDLPTYFSDVSPQLATISPHVPWRAPTFFARLAGVLGPRAMLWPRPTGRRHVLAPQNDGESEVVTIHTWGYAM